MAVWNLDNIYKFKETAKLIDEYRAEIKAFKSIRKQLTPTISSKKFMEILRKSEQLFQIESRLVSYARLWSTENTADAERNAHLAKILELTADGDNEILFFSLWFKDLNDKQANKLIQASGKYHYMLERLRAFKPHSLKEKEEQIINLKNLTGEEAAVRMYDIITNRFRFMFDGKRMSQEEINQYKQSPDRKKRKESYDMVLGKYGEEEDVLGEIYKTIVNDWRNENIKLRKFNTPASVRNHFNDLPDKAVDALLNVVRKNVDLFQEYFKLKAGLLKLKSMDRYDLYAPYAGVEKTYTYEESKKICLDTYKKFDKQAYQLAKKIFDDRHVHSEMVENKRSGAFCYSIVKDLSPYIMLNHMDKLNDLCTMMHEFGHGIHSLAAKEQTDFTFQATLPLAETASIFGEMLLSKRLQKEANKEEKIALLVKSLDSQYASIVRQAFFVLFEKEAHDRIKDGATIQELNILYIDLLKEQFGDMPIADVFHHEWKYIPHIYHTPFYCYAYAFGNLLVLALYRMYEMEGQEFVPKYLKILSYGGSESPEKILKEVGIAITKEKLWEQGFAIIKEELDELKRLV